MQNKSFMLVLLVALLCGASWFGATQFGRASSTASAWVPPEPKMIPWTHFALHQGAVITVPTDGYRTIVLMLSSPSQIQQAAFRVEPGGFISSIPSLGKSVGPWPYCDWTSYPSSNALTLKCDLYGLDALQVFNMTAATLQGNWMALLMS